VLCIRRTLTSGRLSGLASGLGAATADAVYGSIAGFGLTFVSSLLVRQRSWLQLIGGAFLCYLGIKAFLMRPAERPASAKGEGLISAYSSTLFLTLTNPMTILSFTAIFAGLGLLGATGNYASAGLLVLGVFIGSALWWLVLSWTVNLFQTRFSPSGLRWVNRASGLIIAVFGLIAIGSLV